MCGPLCYQFQQCNHVLNSGQVAPCQEAVKNNTLCQGQNGRPAGPPVIRPHAGTCPTCAPVPPAHSLSDLTSKGTEEESDSDDSGSSTTTITGAQANAASQASSGTGTSSQSSSRSERSSRAPSHASSRARNTQQAEARQTHQPSHASRGVRHRDESTSSASTRSSQSTRETNSASGRHSSKGSSRNASSQTASTVDPPARRQPVAQAHNDEARRARAASRHGTVSDVDEDSELTTTTQDARNLPGRMPPGYPQTVQQQQNFPPQTAGAARNYRTAGTVDPRMGSMQGVLGAYPQYAQQQQQYYPPRATEGQYPAPNPRGQAPTPAQAFPARAQQQYYMPQATGAGNTAQATRQQPPPSRPPTPVQTNPMLAQRQQGYPPQTDYRDFARSPQQTPPAVPPHVHFQQPAQANTPPPQQATRGARHTASAAGTTPSVQEWRQQDAPYIHPNSNPRRSERARRHRPDGKDPKTSEKQVEEQRAKAAEHDLKISQARRRALQAEEAAFERDTRLALDDSRPSLQEELEAENQIRQAMLRSLEEYTAKLEQGTVQDSDDELHIYTQCGHQVQRPAELPRGGNSIRPNIEYHDTLCDNCQRYKRQPEPPTARDAHTPAQPYKVPLVYPPQSTAESSRTAIRRAAGQAAVQAAASGHVAMPGSLPQQRQQHYQPSFTPTMGIPYRQPAPAFVSPQRSVADLRAEPEPVERTPSIAGSTPASLEDVRNNGPAEEANRHRLFQEAVEEEQWRQAHPDECSSVTASETSTERTPVASKVSSKAAGKRRA